MEVGRSAPEPGRVQNARTAERNGRSVRVKAISGDAELFEVAGLTMIVEATYGTPARGGHGWHLHIHALVFCAPSLRAWLRFDLPDWVGAQHDRERLARNVFASRAHGRWSAGLKKAAYTLPASVAVGMREVGVGAADYLGRYPASVRENGGTAFLCAWRHG